MLTKYLLLVKNCTNHHSSISLDGHCVNYNGYIQGIHTSISKDKTLKSVRNLLWAYKIHCFIITTTNQNLICFYPYIPYNLEHIHTSFITDVTSSYLTFLCESNVSSSFVTSTSAKTQNNRGKAPQLKCRGPVPPCPRVVPTPLQIIC